MCGGLAPAGRFIDAAAVAIPGIRNRREPPQRTPMTTPRRSGPAPAAVLAVAAAVAAILFLGVLAARGGDVVDQLRHVWASFFPKVATSEQGARIRDLYNIVFFIAVAIFLLVEGLIVWAVVRYRRKPTDEALPPQIHGNNALEVVWTLIPTLIVGFLFFVSWQTLNTVDATTATPDVRIRAVASRFQWTFDYLSPDGQTVVYQQYAPELTVPAGKTVHLTLRSPDVIHAFFVPQFLFKRDVVPGRENNFDFTVDPADAGQTFRGQCAELCGTGHWVMQFSVKALAPADFDAWLQKQVAGANATPAPAGGTGGTGAGQAAGAALQISAQGVAYDTATLEAPANTPFTITFKNNDAGIPHNVSIHRDSPTGDEVFRGEIFSGVDARTYAVPALPAGTYAFVCSVHANMTGTLTVK